MSRELPPQNVSEMLLLLLLPLPDTTTVCSPVSSSECRREEDGRGPKLESSGSGRLLRVSDRLLLAPRPGTRVLNQPKTLASPVDSFAAAASGHIFSTDSFLAPDGGPNRLESALAAGYCGS